MLSFSRIRISSALRCAKLSSSIRTFTAVTAFHAPTPISYADASQCPQRQSSTFQFSTGQHKIQHCQMQWRSYARASAADLTTSKVTERVMMVIKLFEKINADKLTLESHFMKELGLDSLDHVELIMAVEDEFGFEIPDQEAEKLNRPSDIVKYLCQKLEVAVQ